LREDEHFRKQGCAEPVGDHGVETAVLDEHGHVVHGVDQLLHVGADLRGTHRAAAMAGVGSLVRCTDEVVKVRMFGLVELQAPLIPSRTAPEIPTPFPRSSRT
jgi:hypothetical protein